MLTPTNMDETHLVLGMFDGYGSMTSARHLLLRLLFCVAIYTLMGSTILRLMSILCADSVSSLNSSLRFKPGRRRKQGRKGQADEADSETGQALPRTSDCMAGQPKKRRTRRDIQSTIFIDEAANALIPEEQTMDNAIESSSCSMPPTKRLCLVAPEESNDVERHAGLPDNQVDPSSNAQSPHQQSNVAPKTTAEVIASGHYNMDESQHSPWRPLTQPSTWKMV